MNKVTIAFGFAILVGGILIGLSVNELNSLSSHAPQNTATSTVAPVASGTITSEDAAFNTLSAQVQTLNAYLPLLKAIRSGNFAISGNNISVPIGNGSSTDLTTVLNYMQSEINSPKQ